MPIKRSLLFLLVLLQGLLISQTLTPKQAHIKDSLTAKLKADSTHIYRPQKYRPYINLDQRNSFIRGQSININGLQLGVLIKDKHVVGAGGYVITLNSKQKVKTKNDKNVSLNRTLNMDYGTVFYQYVAVDKRYWEIDLQAELGLGTYEFKYYTINKDGSNGKQVADKKAGILVGGVGPLVAFKPTVWIGIIGMVGYRFTSEKNTTLDFNGLYYSYGVWLDVRQMIRDYNYYLVKKRKYKKEIKKLML